jgi:hypothetical protein
MAVIFVLFLIAQTHLMFFLLSSFLFPAQKNETFCSTNFGQVGGGGFANPSGGGVASGNNRQGYFDQISTRTVAKNPKAVFELKNLNPKVVF